jgi:hypothetical protein
MTITATAPRAAAYRGKLRWWTELPLVALIYALYSAARLLVGGDVDRAIEHGADILHFEQFTHLDPEGFFNRLFADHAVLGVPADFAYASLHYVITPSVLVWLWLRRPTQYRMARTWLMLSTLVGLVGFTLLPTAPPRLLPGAHSFIDTMAQYGSWGWWGTGTDASAPHGFGGLTNQYAAMPSLHVGWSLWCGINVFRYGRHRVVRALGLLYPMVTVLVVMGTGNHYLLDAAAGVVTMGLGFLLAEPALRLTDRVSARVLPAFGRSPRRLAERPERGTGTVVTTASEAGAGSAASAGAAAERPDPPEEAAVTGTPVGAAATEGGPGSDGTSARTTARTTVPPPVVVPASRREEPDGNRTADGEHAGRGRMS